MYMNKWLAYMFMSRYKFKWLSLFTATVVMLQLLLYIASYWGSVKNKGHKHSNQLIPQISKRF